MTNIYSDDRHVYSVIPARRYGLASESDAPFRQEAGSG